jgi:hypothetical protein
MSCFEAGLEPLIQPAASPMHVEAHAYWCLANQHPQTKFSTATAALAAPQPTTHHCTSNSRTTSSLLAGAVTTATALTV